MIRGFPSPHHDGSLLHVPDQAPGLGDTVELLLRAPQPARLRNVLVRSVVDGEPVFETAEIAAEDSRDTWWQVPLAVDNPVTGYRFLLEDDGGRQSWLNAAGIAHHPIPDHADFRITTAPPPPNWLSSAVAYQVFPDRFAASGRAPRPDWAIPAAWTDPVRSGDDDAMRQWFGGDLWGMADRVDHLERLGITLLYCNPFFPAESNHRYDASSFDVVDPALGGDEALSTLTRTLHDRGIRMIGDLTLNHCGATHPWFLAACADPEAPERSYFFLRSADDYDAWYDVPSLPKLDHRSPNLRRLLYDGENSAVSRWVREPFGLDGWRIDVANMAGRHGDIDLTHEVARLTRRTLSGARPDAYLVAEHGHDAGGDLSGDGWHGTMNYAGFTQPVWAFLRDPFRGPQFMASPLGLPRLDGYATADTIDAFRSTMPWHSYAASLTLLGSHDTERWRSVAFTAERAHAGLVMLLTFPGVPCLFAGDEVGLSGDDPEAGRATFPWDESAWDHETFELVRRLVRLRRRTAALQRGGFRWAHVGTDVVIYLRELRDERVLVRIAREPHPAVALHPSLGAARAVDLLGGQHLAARDGVLELPASGVGADIWHLSDAIGRPRRFTHSE